MYMSIYKLIGKLVLVNEPRYVYMTVLMQYLGI